MAAVNHLHRIAAAFTLSVALALQYILGLPPCPLCLYARVPYVAMLLLPARWFWLSASAAAVVAWYQVGVERGLWTYACTNSAADFITAMPVSCLRPPRYAGISLGEMNAVWASALTAGALWLKSISAGNSTTTTDSSRP